MRNKKEFLGVLISVLVCVFIVGLAVYATTTVGDSITVSTDLTITGNDLTFGNGAVLTNTDPDVLDITEAYVSVSGDFNIEGNDLIFGNGAALSNADSAELLTITEDLVSVSGDFTIEGNNLTFGNGASLSNTDPDILTLTETLVSVVGTASVSSNFNVSGNSTFAHASVSDDLSIGAAHIFSGTASIAATACDIGDIYIKTGTADINSILSICDATNIWTTASLSGGN